MEDQLCDVRCVFHYLEALFFQDAPEIGMV